MAGPSPNARFHAHVYYEPDGRGEAQALRDALQGLTGPDGERVVAHAGALRDGKVGPHPISQFEIHFFARDLPLVSPMLEAAGLRVLIHPLTDDDLADHTSLGRWIGEPLELDLSVLDPPGLNQGVARFGKNDF